VEQRRLEENEQSGAKGVWTVEKAGCSINSNGGHPNRESSAAFPEGDTMPVKNSERFFNLLSFALLSVVLVLASSASAQWKEKVLYSFQGIPDGSTPVGGVVFGPDGNLYGATAEGGANNCPGIAQCGTVFQLTPPAQKDGAWTEAILYVFRGKTVNDGSTPSGGVILDKEGNVYGTTGYGGAGTCMLLGGNVGCGTVWELSPPQQKDGKWTETILYSFKDANDGYLPYGGLAFDSVGNLYGATEFGGGKGTSCNSLYGGQCGTVFELSPLTKGRGKWSKRVLHSFAGINPGKQDGDGAQPNGGLALDMQGAVYGTTYFGGYNCPHNSNQGCGTAFVLRPPTVGGVWSETLIHVFQAGKDGGEPNGDLILNNDGDLYGTAGGGPSGDAGIIFRLRKDKAGAWQKMTLYGFNSNGEFGSDPLGGLTFDSSGNLYGTTYSAARTSGLGFRLNHGGAPGSPWSLSVLYGFKGSPDGAQPAANLVFHDAGKLYSTTQQGGTGSACQVGCGTVFQLWPN
jgi:hypothetical protein